MRRTSLTAAALLTLVLATGSACRASDDSASRAADPPAAAAGSPATGNPATGSNAGSGDDTFCALAKEKGGANLAALDGTGDMSPEQLHQLLANFDAVAAAAPAAVHADFARVDAFEHKLFDAGGTINGQLAQEASGEQLRTSMKNVAAYLDQHCGIHA